MKNNSDDNSPPEIQVNSRQLRDIIADAWNLLTKVNEPNPKVFQRENNLVGLISNKEGIQIKSYNIDSLFGLLIRNADWMRENESGEMKHSRPPKDVVRDLLTNPRQDFPSLEAIITTPVFSSAGKLILTSGYNKENALFLSPHRISKIAPISETPNVDEISKARNLLSQDLLGDFPFDSISDLANALGAMVLPFVRRLFNGCTPLHSIESPEPGSGKGLLTNVISIVTTGAEAHARTLPGSDDEIRKMLTAELSRGLPIILLDNADIDGSRNRLHSPSLASVLTSQLWTDRILGHSEMASLPNNALWILTANNPTFTSELSRRAVRIRLNAKMDRPWCRNSSDFRHSDLKAWTHRHRGELIHALLTLAQAWIAAGQPQCLERNFGSFEPYAATIGGLLKTVGIDGFLGNMEKTYKESDVEHQEWIEFVEAWDKKFNRNSIKASALIQLCDDEDLLSNVLGSGNDRSRQTKLGNALQRQRDRVFNSFQIVLSKDAGKGGKFYSLVLVEGAAKFSDNGNENQDDAGDFEDHTDLQESDEEFFDEPPPDLFIESEDPPEYLMDGYEVTEGPLNDPSYDYFLVNLEGPPEIDGPSETDRSLGDYDHGEQALSDEGLL